MDATEQRVLSDCAMFKALIRGAKTARVVDAYQQGATVVALDHGWPQSSCDEVQRVAAHRRGVLGRESDAES